MVCLDGSKNLLKGIDTANLICKTNYGFILDIHSDTTCGLFTAVHVPKIKRKIIK